MLWCCAQNAVHESKSRRLLTSIAQRRSQAWRTPLRCCGLAVTVYRIYVYLTLLEITLSCRTATAPFPLECVCAWICIRADADLTYGAPLSPTVLLAYQREARGLLVRRAVNAGASRPPLRVRSRLISSQPDTVSVHDHNLQARLLALIVRNEHSPPTALTLNRRHGLRLS